MTKPPTELSSATATREKILDAAELLLIERGFAATSLRAIAGKAGVNLAATHYHFGSKNGLLAAVFHRRIDPINEQRLSALAKLREEEPSPTARQILQAFFGPFMNPELYGAIPAVLGRISGEPEAITRPLLESEFSEVMLLFESALDTALPQVSRQQLKWRMHFIVGSMIHLLRLNAPLGLEASRKLFVEGLQELINFSIAGLEQAGTGEQHA